MVTERQQQTLPAHSPTRPEPAKQSAAMDLLARLFSAFPERDSAVPNQAEKLRAYLVAVEGVSLPVLEEAERRILKAEAGCDPRFLPSPPELAAICRSIIAEWRAWEMPQRQPLSLERFEAPPDPKLVQRFGEVVSELAKTVDIENHETKAEWLKRMGDRVKLLEDA